MALFIYKNNQQYGPYSIDQLKVWLSSGQIQSTDLACYEGSTNWVPVSTLVGVGNQAAAVPSTYGRPSSGWGLIIGGVLLTLIGIPLSAIIMGIPLVIVGIPMLIYGRAQYQKRLMWDLKESVRVGVVQGMPAQGYLPPQHHSEQARLRAPSRRVAQLCSSCGATLDAAAKFCPACAAPTS